LSGQPMKRAFTIMCFCAFSGLAVWGQIDATTIHVSFGKPEAEVFMVAPGIRLKVTYSVNEDVCGLVLKTDKAITYTERQSTTQQLHEFVDKTVPVGLLGEKSDVEIESINGCSGFKLTRFENVDITETIFSDGPGCSAEMNIQVRFTTSMFNDCPAYDPD
jgi:hypothetical protein